MRFVQLIEFRTDRIDEFNATVDACRTYAGCRAGVDRACADGISTSGFVVIRASAAAAISRSFTKT